jgi:hypothetical protein
MFRGLPVLPAALSSRLKSRAARQLENLALLNHGTRWKSWRRSGRNICALHLFRAFDERANPARMRVAVLARRAGLEAIMETLGIL